MTIPDKSRAAESHRAAIIANLRAKLARAMAVLDRKEAHLEESFRRLGAAAAAHVVSTGALGLAVVEAERTGRASELPYTAASLSREARVAGRDLQRATRLLENARREIVAARAQALEHERMIDALEAQVAAERASRPERPIPRGAGRSRRRRR